MTRDQTSAILAFIFGVIFVTALLALVVIPNSLSLFASRDPSPADPIRA
jgi:hypothetical protein